MLGFSHLSFSFFDLYRRKIKVPLLKSGPKPESDLSFSPRADTTTHGCLVPYTVLFSFFRICAAGKQNAAQKRLLENLDTLRLFLGFEPDDVIGTVKAYKH